MYSWRSCYIVIASVLPSEKHISIDCIVEFFSKKRSNNTKLVELTVIFIFD